MATHKHSVCVAFISPGEVRHEFASSLVSTMRYYSEKSRKVIRAQIDIQSGPRVAEARSQVVDSFAKTNCDWLWMVDADMSWQENALDLLLETADPVDAPIMGGLCFGGRSDHAMFPTIYKLIEEEGMIGTEVVHDYPKDQVVRVGATGAAFMLVHKSVFVKMKHAFGKLPNGRENPYPWFVEAANGGRPFGEDIAFCIKAHALDLPIYVDTRVKIGHIKPRELTEERYLEERKRASKVEAQPLTLP